MPGKNGPCQDFEHDLVLYHYGECGEAERRRLEVHLQGCSSCRSFLEQIGSLRSLTGPRDEPDEPFWEAYSLELRGKLHRMEEPLTWWKRSLSLLGPWPVPALAMALVLALVVTLTFTQKARRPGGLSPEEQSVLEFLPIAENLEFFSSMELLDALELLESLGPNGSA